MNSINNWPESERPRERLLKLGVEKLTDAELLAIFLRTGSRGENALELARNLLERFKNLRQFMLADAEKLKSLKGLGPAKISQLKAILELSSRYLKEEIEKKEWLGSSEAVFRFLYHSMRDLDHEILKIIFLNAQNQIIGLEDIAGKNPVKNSIDPKKIISSSIKHNASGVIFVHNHPSGDPKPSQKDKKMTAKMFLICELMEIKLLDHIIIGDNRHYSFADSGLI